MDIIAIILLLCGSSWWWIPLLFRDNNNRSGCGGCITFIIGVIIGGLIIIGCLYG